jgi:O-acetyl-ADP-ribose deacetylase (regulator of RNase III)
MAEIQYRTGSLLDAPERYLAHGCNDRGVMGAGIAPLIKGRFPEAFTVYREEYLRRGEGLPTGLLIPVASRGKVILNLITQQGYGRDKSVLYADYEGIRHAMAAVDAYVEPGAAVAMPLIGAGLANGKWSIISRIIAEEARGFVPVVHLLDGVIPSD